MSAPPSNLGKSLAPATGHPPSTPAGPSTSSFESPRRQSQSPGLSSSAAPRKSQGSRRQHKNQRRPGMGASRQGPDVEDDDMAEIRAVRNASSRRGQTSITHLLSYTLAPSTAFADRGPAGGRSYRRNPTWGPGSGHHAADKARYVHANYRFVVSPAGDYRAQAADADRHLDWGDVLQVLASSESQATGCPICLSDPVAPRMARCGHIFCLSCLIRFMNSASDEGESSRQARQTRWRRCPICEDSVYLHDVRPVRFYAGQESPLPRAGDDVMLRLMARSASSTLALPRESGADSTDPVEDVPWHFAANVLDYARVMKGTADYMAEQHDEEVRSLRRQEQEDEQMYGEDGDWTRRAVRAVEAAKEKLEGLVTAEAVMAEKAALPVQPKQRPEPDYYFYSSQPHLYLSPLDIRILKTKYGSFSQFPSTLLPRVEHITTGHVVDHEQRRRARYLSHLPQGCLISLLECDWTDIVPADILGAFADEIERRRKRNRDNATHADRVKQQAERLEAASMRSAFAIPRPPSAADDAASSSPSSRINPSDFQPLLGHHSGTTPPNPRAGFGPLASVSTSPSQPRTVWGTPAVPVSPDLAAAAASERAPPLDEVDDGWLKDEQLLGTAEMAMQMEALAVDGPSAGGAAGAGQGRRKKKKQKITLMSTGSRRAG